MAENDMFDELMESVKEMDDIVKGKSQPTRRFEFEPHSERVKNSRFRDELMLVCLMGLLIGIIAGCLVILF